MSKGRAQANASSPASTTIVTMVVLAEPVVLPSAGVANPRVMTPPTHAMVTTARAPAGKLTSSPPRRTVPGAAVPGAAVPRRAVPGRTGPRGRQRDGAARRRDRSRRGRLAQDRTALGGGGDVQLPVVVHEDVADGAVRGAAEQPTLDGVRGG